MINYYCPGFTSGRRIYENIFALKEHWPEIFEEDTSIRAIFGAFPNMKWNGGGVNIQPGTFWSEIVDTKEFYEYYGIPLQLTLTNSSVKPEDLQDDYCNRILELMDNGLNEVLVSCELMESYIRKYYPNYSINRSIVNTPQDYDWETALKTGRYKNIVLPRRYVKDFEYLGMIDESCRGRIEILCNDPCPADCPYLYSHYKRFEKATLGDPAKVDYECRNEKLKTLPFAFDFEMYISLQDIREKYSDLGYTEFKLSGRSSETTVLTSVYEYIIKPKYQSLFLKSCLR